MKTPIRYLCPLLQVFDMNTSLKFYCDVLGFRIHESAGPKDALDWVWLKLDDVDLMLNTAYEAPFRPEHPDPARIASHDDTALFLGCPDVDAAYRELLSTGIKLSPPTVAPYGIKQLYVHDPDGYNLCFQWQEK